MLSFVYVLLQAIQIVGKVEDSLKKLLNRTLDALLQSALAINEQYYAATGADLPDAATDFLYKQIRLIKDWFMELIEAIHFGMWVGVVVAAIVTFLSLVFTFYDFRWRSLSARMGKLEFPKAIATLNESGIPS